jgi:DNA polymerase-4
MRGAGRTGRTVTLRLRFNDFGRVTRSRTLPRATCSTQVLLETARHLVTAAAPLIVERGLTLVGFAVSGISASDSARAEQLVLPFTTRAEPGVVDAAIDSVRRRYGTSALTRGVLVGREVGLEVPHLPD